MTIEERYRDNAAAYFDMPIELMPEHDRLWDSLVIDWPESLKAFCREVRGRVGWGTDIAQYVAIADWLKKEHAEQNGRWEDDGGHAAS